MTVLTEQGKDAALRGLAERRAANKDKKLPRNEDLPAGAPMYFRCIGCGETLIEPEGYISRNKMCDECMALREFGWLE